MHDDPLTQVSVGVLNLIPGGDGGVMTGSGGTTGSDGGMVAGGGGTVGSGGRPAPTGTAGTGSPGGSGMAGTTGDGTGKAGTTGMGGSIGTGGGIGGGTAGTGGTDPVFATTLGTWTFDDCNTFRTNLFDSSSFRATPRSARSASPAPRESTARPSRS